VYIAPNINQIIKTLMKKLKICLMASASLLVVLTTFAFKPIDFGDIKGWFLAGSDPKSYQIGVVKDQERGGNVGYIKSVKEANGFGTIMQSFIPSDYVGKRVRLTGYIKSKDVKDWAGMWFRIDGEDNKPLGFDNMQKRAVKGTTTWKKYEIVLNAPENSKAFAFGVLLSGTGEVWLDDLKFEVVDKTVPLTDITLKDATPNKPRNSSFEDAN
jgi:hypothetical protein